MNDVLALALGQLPARKKRRDPEHDAQVALFKLIRMHPTFRSEPIAAIPNGGHRHLAVAAKLKAAGTSRGVPDILYFRPRGQYRGLAIEMKHGKNRPTEDQKSWMASLENCGWRCVVCYSTGDAWQELLDYYEGRAT